MVNYRIRMEIEWKGKEIRIGRRESVTSLRVW
jgi:hypothetical protein